MADLAILLSETPRLSDQFLTARRQAAARYRASIYSTTAAGTYTTSPTYTPEANSLIVVFVINTYASAPVDPTGVTAHGVTLTKVTLPSNTLSTTHIVSVWVGNSGASPTSAAAVATCSGTTTGAAVIEFQVTDCDLTDSALKAVSCVNTATGTATTGTVAVSLTPHVTDDSVQLSFWLHFAVENTTGEAGWVLTSGGTGSFATPSTGGAGFHKNDGIDLTATASWTTSSSFLGVAIEVVGTPLDRPLENVRVSEQLTVRRYGDATAGPENVKVDDAGVVQIISEGGLHITDAALTVQLVAAGGDLSATPAEAIKAADTVTITEDPEQATPAESIKAADTLSITENPEQATPSEAVKVADTVSTTLNPEQATPSEAVKVSETPALTLDPEQATPAEAVKVADTVATTLDPEQASLAEAARAADSLAVTLDPENATPTEAVKCADTITVSMDAAGGDLARVLAEALAVTDTAVLTLNPEEATPSEAVKAADTAALTLNPEETAPSEGVKVADTVATSLNPEQATPAEAVKASDLATLTLDPEQTSLAESVKVSDTATTSLNPEQATPAESVRAADTLTIVEDPEQATPAESVRVADTITLQRIGSGELVPGDELVHVADTVAVTLDPEQTSVSEAVKVADTITPAIEELLVLGEAIKVTDTVAVTENPEQATPSETAKVTDTVTAQLTVLQLVLAESARVADTVTRSIDPEQTTPSESVKVADTLTIGVDLNVPSETYPGMVRRDGAAGHWRLNDLDGLTAVDSIGTHGGVLTAGITVGQPGPRDDGAAAMLFDGAANHFAFVLNGGETVNGASAASFEAWAFPVSFAHANNFILSSTNTGNNLRITSAGVVSVSMGVGALNWGASSSAGLARLGQWIHIVGVYDGNTTIRLYVNAVEVGSFTTITPGAIAFTGNLFIGGLTSAQGLNGVIADVALYPFALTPAQVREHYGITERVHVTDTITLSINPLQAVVSEVVKCRDIAPTPFALTPAGGIAENVRATDTVAILKAFYLLAPTPARAIIIPSGRRTIEIPANVRAFQIAAVPRAVEVDAGVRTLVIPSTHRTIRIETGGGHVSVASREQCHDAKLDYSFDYEPWLEGDTLSASTWEITPVDADASIANPSYPPVFTATTATVWLVGGKTGQRYELTNHITTAAGRQDERTIIVTIVQT